MKVIAFSGGCLSGKSTTMELLKHRLEDEGNKVILLDELMREQKVTSIDDIRKKPSEYLKIQKQIIEDKITQELGIEYHVLKSKLDCVKNNKDVEEYYVLINRAISDSIFYLLFYVDKSQLSLNDLKIYEELYRFADVCAHKIFGTVYDLVVSFEPIKFKAKSDEFRPKNIDILKFTESRFILSLTHYYMYDNKHLIVDMNEYENKPQKAVDIILKELWEG